MVISHTYSSPIQVNVVGQDALVMMPMEAPKGLIDVISTTTSVKGAFRTFNTMNRNNSTFP